MNAIPMLIACVMHQWLYVVGRCDCGAERPLGTAQCATCNLKARLRWHEKYDR